jgi:hypothetical protein
VVTSSTTPALLYTFNVFPVTRARIHFCHTYTLCSLCPYQMMAPFGKRISRLRHRQFHKNCIVDILFYLLQTITQLADALTSSLQSPSTSSLQSFVSTSTLGTCTSARHYNNNPQLSSLTNNNLRRHASSTGLMSASTSASTLSLPSLRSGISRELFSFYKQNFFS